MAGVYCSSSQSAGARSHPRRVLLVRHADAKGHSASGADVDRELSAKGAGQAERLCALLCHRKVSLLASSPATRCRATIEPLGRRLGLEVLEIEELSIGSSGEMALRALFSRADEAGAVVACSHADVLHESLEFLSAAGARIIGRIDLRKAATTEIELAASGECSVRFIAPP